jgi:hypothetical protein
LGNVPVLISVWPGGVLLTSAPIHASLYEMPLSINFCRFGNGASARYSGRHASSEMRTRYLEVGDWTLEVGTVIVDDALEFGDAAHAARKTIVANAIKTFRNIFTSQSFLIPDL